jgi:hypothetical protein
VESSSSPVLLLARASHSHLAAFSYAVSTDKIPA